MSIAPVREGLGLVSRRRTGTADLSTNVGAVSLPSPVMCASGTAGHGAELADYFDLSSIGAVVVKSLLHEPWPGNPPPRVWGTDAGMINSVGLQGPGVQAWIDDHLDPLAATGARVVASIWGRTVDEFASAAELLQPVSLQLTALEVNISCPNVEDRDRMFAHSPAAAHDAVAAVRAAVPAVPLWGKLSPNIADLVPIADAVSRAGADAVTIANTLIGLVIDVERRRPRLGRGRGGLSGPAIRPVAVRAVNDVATALPELPIIGCGGIARGVDALEFVLAGASAVQVGTATFADPRAVVRIHDEIERWCEDHGVTRLRSLIGDLEPPRAHAEDPTHDDD